MQKIIFTFLVLVILLFSGLPGKARAFKKDAPFYPGEKLTYRLRWNFIPAGEAVLEVLPIVTINGVQSYHFVLTAKSNSFVDLFYKVRDRIDAYSDLDMIHSILYRKKQKEGRTKRNVIVNFDWDKKEAQYSNFKKKKKPIPLLPGSFDPLSVYYFSRFIDLEKNSEIRRPVTDGKKCVIGIAKVIKREKIKLKSGTYDTYLMVPDLKHLRGVFEKSKNAKIKLWVSADKARIPVKIKSKVIVGSFIGELISAEGIVGSGF